MTALADVVERLEVALGDPSHDEDTGFAATLAADEAESFPIVAWAKLGSVGFARSLVPVDDGGSFADVERLVALGRCVARRDLTLAIAMGQCLLGAIPTWIAGSAAQRRFVASALQNGESGALALTERAHGSDLAAIEASAAQEGQGYRLDGEKWAINNAARGRYFAVLARTEDEDGGRGHSLLLVDTLSLAESATRLPKIPTLGIRGADVGGCRFVDAPLDADAIVGEPGEGLALVQGTMRVARTVSAAFSLGAADTALRAALGYAMERSIYGHPLFSLGATRARLREAFVAFHAADLVAHAAARALSIAPEQAAVNASVAKLFVTETAQRVVDDAAGILGVRHSVREGKHAILQKILRDVRMVHLFDGSASLGRSALAPLALGVTGVRLEGPELAEAVARTLALVQVGAPIDPVDFGRMRGPDRAECDAFHALAAFAGGLVPLPEGVRPLAARAHSVAERLRAVHADPGVHSLPDTHERAHQLADVFASLVVVALLVARASIAAPEEQVILEAALRRHVGRLEGRSPMDHELDDPIDASARLDAAMAQSFADARAFGPLGAQLAEDPATWRVF